MAILIYEMLNKMFCYRTANKVTSDTKVFEEGSLGKAPDG